MGRDEVDGMARSTSIGFVKVRAATNTCGKLAFHARVSFDEAPHAVSEPWRYRVYHGLPPVRIVTAK